MSEVEAQNGSAASPAPKAATAASPEAANGHENGYPADYAEAEGEYDEGEESDEYDFEEEQQAVEGEGDEYVDLGEDEEGEDGGQQQQNGNASLTALLLGDPNSAEYDDEGEYDDEDDDGQDAEDGEGDNDQDYEDEDRDYDDESKDDVEPITPTTAKKRSLDEALEEAASPREENEAKKVKA